MPLLDYCNDIFNMDLKNTLLISCHHILESNLFLLHYLFDKKLDPKNARCLWKCYSTNLDIYNAYKDEWINISEKSFYFDPERSFEDQFLENIHDFLENIQKNIKFDDYEKVIVRDDWWLLIQEINKLSCNKNNFFAIEHTSNWFYRLENQKISFPIINVARSNVKLKNESPFIVDLITKNFENFINSKDISIKKILIVWWWAIWLSLYEKLKKNYIVDIYDIDNTKTNIYWDLLDIIDDYDVVFWATGNNILTYDQFKNIKKWVILISCSSWDYEFCALDIRFASKKIWIRDDMEVDWKWLLNWWFPITFTWKREWVWLKEIQLTRWIIYWAVYQIINMQKNIFHDWFLEYDTNIQNVIYAKFKQLV